MWWALALLLLVGQVASTVVTLTDASFEHHTQAATGQTTGVWFVSLAPAGNARAARMAPTWDAAAERVATSHPELVFAQARKP
jgi:hypothetical protein